MTPRERRAERLLALKANPKHPGHGTVNGYNLGCRCPRCVAVKRSYNHEHYEAMKRGEKMIGAAAARRRLKHLNECARPRTVNIHQIGEVSI